MVALKLAMNVGVSVLKIRSVIKRTSIVRCDADNKLVSDERRR